MTLTLTFDESDFTEDEKLSECVKNLIDRKSNDWALIYDENTKKFQNRSGIWELRILAYYSPAMSVVCTDIYLNPAGMSITTNIQSLSINRNEEIKNILPRTGNSLSARVDNMAEAYKYLENLRLMVDGEIANYDAAAN